MLQKITHAAADAAIKEHLFFQTPIHREEKGSNNCLNFKNPALEAKVKVNTPRLWAEPKAIHSVLCAKYRAQEPSCPWPSPAHMLIKLPEASHTFTGLKGPNHAPEKTFLSRTIWWLYLRFLQTHATNRYFGMVNSGGFLPLVFH